MDLGKRVVHGQFSTRLNQIRYRKGVIQPRPVARSGNGGVRKIINVDLTSGRWPRWVARYEKWGAGGWGVGGLNHTTRLRSGMELQHFCNLSVSISIPYCVVTCR